MSSTAKSTGERPLVYFFSGDRLPSYWRDSIRISSRGWSGPIVVLTDCRVLRSPRNAEIIDFTEFFDPRGFESFCARTPLDGEFRKGFWYKTVLRFFVLEQFMRARRISSFLHLEFDVAGFSLDRVPFELDQFGRGAFVPWLTDSHGIASAIYVNHLGGLTRILGGFDKYIHLGHEMAMLGAILRDGSGIFGLPTSGTLAKIVSGESLPTNHVLPSRRIGVFDAAPIGHWILGNDPRNQRGELVRNHFVFDYVDCSRDDLERIDLKLSLGANSVELETAAGSFALQSLHVHSKALYLVRWRPVFRWILSRSRSTKSRLLPIPPARGSFRDGKLSRWGEVRLVRLRAFLTRSRS